MQSLSLLRGIWTLFSSYGSWSMQFGPSGHESIGIIHTGPIHTVHYPNGKLATSSYWFDSDYRGDRKLFDPKSGWSHVEEKRLAVGHKLRNLPYAKDLRRILVRYVKALDQHNLDVACLQMWSLLELITDTIAGRYEETIRRAIWAYEDHSTAKEMLETLRTGRNQFVHSAQGFDESDQTAYLVKSFIDPHLLWLIRNSFRVSSLQEYGKFLALPTDQETLSARKRQLERAIRLRQHWSNSSK